MSELFSKVKDEDIKAAALLVIRGNAILCGKRKDNGQICGPGGHREEGEDVKKTAIREAYEEFNVESHTLIPLGVVKPNNGDYLTSMVYMTNEYDGNVETDEEEMTNCQFLTLEELVKEDLFPPFKDSLIMLLKALIEDMNEDGGAGSGNWGHGGRKGKRGGSARGTGGVANRKGSKETGFTSTAKEKKQSKSVAGGGSGNGSSSGGSGGSSSANKSTNRKVKETFKKSKDDDDWEAQDDMANGVGRYIDKMKSGDTVTFKQGDTRYVVEDFEKEKSITVMKNDKVVGKRQGLFGDKAFDLMLDYIDYGKDLDVE